MMKDLVILLSLEEEEEKIVSQKVALINNGKKVIYKRKRNKFINLKAKITMDGKIIIKETRTYKKIQRDRGVTIVKKNLKILRINGLRKVHKKILMKHGV